MDRLTRRRFLGAAIGVGAAGAAAPLLQACAPGAAPAPPSPAVLGPPEAATIRIEQTAPCEPWYWLSEPFLREEGFTDIRYGAGDLGAGTAEFGVSYGNTLTAAVDAGVPVLAVAGTHTGCIEVWARPGINTIADLRGKTIAVNTKTFAAAGKPVASVQYGFLVSLLAYVGMQPGDANFIEIGADKSLISYFVDGKADAILTAGPTGPLMHGTKNNPGRVILSTSLDKPWSQTYCCMLVTNRDWARANPVAVKRATRAILRAIDAGKRDLRATAKAAIEKGTYKAAPVITEQVVYDVIKDQSFDWRDYDPEETVRFFSLRLAEAKLIKRSPQQIIAEGTDFAYFRQLRKEIKA